MTDKEKSKAGNLIYRCKACNHIFEGHHSADVAAEAEEVMERQTTVANDEFVSPVHDCEAYFTAMAEADPKRGEMARVLAEQHAGIYGIGILIGYRFDEPVGHGL